MPLMSLISVEYVYINGYFVTIVIDRRTWNLRTWWVGESFVKIFFVVEYKYYLFGEFIQEGTVHVLSSGWIFVANMLNQQVS